MTPRLTPPRWSRAAVALPGLGMLGFGGVTLYAPHLPFGPDAYRIPVRVATGLLGAAASGLGAAALEAAATADPAALRSATLALLGASTLVPPVILYNVGYFDTVATDGTRALSLIGGVILGAGVPLLLNLRVLNRLLRARRTVTR